jgi:crotonobetaine/carnitine-CoA ligase
MNDIPWTTDAALRRATSFGAERIAVVQGEDGASLTYGRLDELANRMANLLRALGVAPGDRVAVLMENDLDYLVAYHGVGRSRAIFVPIVTQSTLDEVAYFVGHSTPRVLIVDEPRWQVVADAIARGDEAFSSLRTVLGKGKVVGRLAQPLNESLEGASPSWREDGPSPADPVAFMYTSGSTGRPKAVIHSHYTAIAQAQAVCSRMGYTRDDRLMTVFPLFHGNALVWSALAACWAAARVVIHRRFSASGFWDSARRHGATEVNLLLGSINMILAQPPSEDDRRHSVRLVLANVTEPIYQRFTQRFGLDIVSTWALAEGPLGTMTAPGYGYREGLIGWPMGEDNVVAVVDEFDNPLPPGQVGELVQRNRAVMLGYYRNEEETSRVMRNGWMHSGDLGYQGADGMFYFAGRKKHVIRRSGENVSGQEVEECLQRHPAVQEAAVVAVPDPIRGEEVKAIIVIRPDLALTPEAVVEWCGQRLAPFKVPRYVEFVTDLPRTGPVKLDRAALASRAHDPACWDRLAGQGRS